jgi:hypothetical protein
VSTDDAKILPMCKDLLGDPFHGLTIEEAVSGALQFDESSCFGSVRKVLVQVRVVASGLP